MIINNGHYVCSVKNILQAPVCALRKVTPGHSAPLFIAVVKKK